METKITSKTTKAELLMIIKQQEELLKQREGLVDDPIKEQKEAEKERVLKSAAENIDSDMFSEDLVKKYKDVVAAVAAESEKLQELYAIEAKAQTLTALINAYKIKSEELEDNHKEKIADLNKKYLDQKAEYDQSIADLEQQKKDHLQDMRNTYKEETEQLNKLRQRDKEDYEYTLNRTRQQDTDAWNDEKVAREKEMVEKEADLQARLDELAKKEDHLKELEEQVAAFPDKLKEAEEAGKGKGKADADKSHVFEVRAIKNEYEYQVKTLQDKLDTQAQLISNLTDRNEALENKLDASYAQMRELAADTVKSTGGVKILSSGDNKGVVSK